MDKYLQIAERMANDTDLYYDFINEYDRPEELAEDLENPENLIACINFLLDIIEEKRG